MTLLAAFPSPSQGVWHLGPVPLRAYALFIIVGIIAALVIGDRRWEARGGERGVIYDIALWAVPFGLIGGRLYHVLTDWQTYFGADGAGAGAALRIWDGGLGIWGAVALGALGAWIGCKRRGIPLPAFGDAIAPGIVLAQAIGRLGNYFNQELYGRPTDLPWGMEIFYRQDPSGIIDVHSLNGVSTGQVAAVVHPTFLYELLCNLAVFALLLYVDKRYKIGHGRLFALYVAGYCVGRFAVELMRDDFATQIAGIRINSFTATFVFIGAIVYFILAPKGREAPETLGGTAEREAPADTLEKELVTAAAPTGVVAAATVAAAEDADDGTLDDDPFSEPVDDDPFSEPVDEDPFSEREADEPEVPEAEEPEPEADEPEVPEAEANEDQAIVEAEVVADGGLVVETVAEADEPQLVDEDHDPVDAEVLDSLDGGTAVVVEHGPVSEQQEELGEADAKLEVDEQAGEEEEAAEGEALVVDTADEAGVDGAAVDEPEAEDEQVIDEDHDPVDAQDLASVEESVAVVEPVSEQQEELGEADAKLEVDEQAAGEEEAAEGEALVVDTADEAGVDEPAEVDEPEAEDEQVIDEDHDPVDAQDLESLEESVAVVEPVSEQQEELGEADAKLEVDEQAAEEEEAAEGEALVVDTADEAGVDEPEAEDEPAEDQPAEAPASDYVVITTPPPAAPQQGSRLGRLLRRRRS
jgi:prolipoprotein diacylglyceryl transferase